MFYVTNIFVGFFMTLIATIGWATINNAVLCTKASPGVYHFHFMIWRFIWVLVFALILGCSAMPPDKGKSVFNNLIEVFRAPARNLLQKIGATFVAGFTDMLFQIFIMTGVRAAGLSNSIPLQIGLATFVGSFITYLIERRAKLAFFIPGVCFNVIAVVFNSITYRYLSEDQKKQEEAAALLEEGREAQEEQVMLISTYDLKSPSKISVWKLIGICIIGACMAAFWSPMSTVAGSDPYSLNPYSLAIVVSFWSALTALPFSYAAMQHPISGPPSTLRDIVHIKWSDLFPSVWAGFFWAMGTLGYTLGAGSIGFAISYVLSQSTPFISSLYAICYWKEFKAASKKTWFYEWMMLLSLAVSVILLCLSE